MMKLTAYLAQVALLSQSKSLVGASFKRDVATRHKAGKKSRGGAAMEQALLAKAIPLEEYEAKLRGQGHFIRRLDDAGDDAAADDYGYQYDYQNNYAANDDAAAAQGNNEYGDFSFDAYALKYAKCQPVQRFSEEAIEAGEYSPMIVDDIVIIRMCPSRFCSVSKTYGCHYNYADYAIGLSVYVGIMLEYKMDKTEQLCEWCEDCSDQRQRQLDNGGDDDNWNNYNYGGDDNYNDPCANYGYYCSNEYGNSTCDDADGDDGYLGIEDYFDYLDCVNIKDDQDYSYWVQPRCDGETETITMGLYYDQFCSQYVGDETSLQSLGLNFREGYLEDLYSTSSCIDCADSDTAPEFSAGNELCSTFFYSAAKCTASLQSDQADNSVQSATECSFIDSIRAGVYDKNGMLYGNGSGSTERNVTNGQKWGLGISLSLLGILAIYSCYLHHSITNLLIKSLSHTDLLPAPRRGGRGSRERRTSGRRDRSRSGEHRRSPNAARRDRYADDDEDADWEEVKGVAA